MSEYPVAFVVLVNLFLLWHFLAGHTEILLHFYINPHTKSPVSFNRSLVESPGISLQSIHLLTRMAVLVFVPMILVVC